MTMTVDEKDERIPKATGEKLKLLRSVRNTHDALVHIIDLVENYYPFEYAKLVPCGVKKFKKVWTQDDGFSEGEKIAGFMRYFDAREEYFGLGKKILKKLDKLHSEEPFILDVKNKPYFISAETELGDRYAENCRFAFAALERKLTPKGIENLL